MNAPEAVPLCVDLDGTFAQATLSHESLPRLTRQRPLRLILLPFWWIGGLARSLKRLAQSNPAPARPPAADEPLEAFLQAARKLRQPLHRLGHESRNPPSAIDRLFASHEIIHCTPNLTGEAKAALLVARFGEKAFDYAGDPEHAKALEKHARRVFVIHPTTRSIQPIGQDTNDTQIPRHHASTWQDWIKALRIHQWAKNLLIAIPFLVGHHYHAAWQLAGLLAAFLSMSLCASGTYLWNDLLDLDHDRAHPRKKQRLAASGKTSIPRIALAALSLVTIGLGSGFLLAPSFGFLLIAYIAATLTYSLYLKRIALADIFLLAFLYLSRLVAGILISEAVISFWLFAFTFLLFLSLAAAKRFVELNAHSGTGETKLHGRGYQTRDLPLLSQLGIASGIASCIVLGLYSNSPQVTALYRHPEWFWGICIASLQWITRIWLLSHRGEMHDDPVVFALKDPITWLTGAAGIACLLLAAPIPPP
ncbi:MAG: UbiA family prenyltransferase [Verrucomicrobia bacterium]|nr:MAG: UbiA family prenyltransferase [Verrucomicrobiota bacterium]TAE88859.1 MAG: UbiA family prenyltransferase [Verrucomicrobiota bacterium]TAF27276.1 MAG: UbiA family prenyltransferase [Verrucomicrobiota bacterium]TAF42433.1 MAG: UbiA family prenyltransferase [Verrucomicrobiota bacterium]